MKARTNMPKIQPSPLNVQHRESGRIPARTPKERRCVRCPGFTLVELLAAVAIVGVLSGILVVGVSSARTAAERTEAISSARSLIKGYLMTPLENQGRYLEGYADTGSNLRLRNGRTLNSGSEEAKRYPWRLAPHLGDSVESLYVGNHKDYYEQIAAHSPYSASLHPSFGMNTIFVGGHYDGRTSSPAYRPGGRSRGASTLPPSFWVLRPGDAENPSNLIVFATALYSSPPDYPGPVGFHRVLPPRSPGNPSWGSYNPEIPANMGHVSLEYGDQAVVAHLDGSVASLGEEEIRDMRRWSNQAAKHDDPDFSSWSRK